MKKDKGWIQVLLLGLLVFLITGIPYFYGWFSAPPMNPFAGFVEGHEDTYQYFSFVRQAAEGRFFFEDRYTTTLHAPWLINWVWWGLGKGMALTGLSMGLTYQLFRLATTFLFTITLYCFLGRFHQGAPRLWGVTLILFGGGFGGILKVLNKLFQVMPSDFGLPDVWLVESHAFFSLMIWPHFSLAVSLMLWIFMAFIKGLEQNRWSYYGGAGVLSLLLLFSHPFEFGVLFPVLSLTALIWTLARREGGLRAIGGLLLFLVLSLPGLIYYYFLNQQQVWKEVMGQMNLSTPDPLQMAFGYGLPFLLAVLTFRGLPPLTKIRPSQLLITSWFVGGFFMFYLPVSFRWHLVNGWQVPLYVLALQGVDERIIPYLKEKKFRLFQRWEIGKLFYISLMIFISLTSLYLIQSKITKMKQSALQPPYYLHQEEVEALNWLSRNTKPDEVVFSGVEMGNVIPALAGNRVFVGHYCLTPRYAEKRQAVKAFWLQPDQAFDRISWLRSQGIRYVFQGQEEKSLGHYDPGQEGSIKKVFSNNRITIYKLD
jgi:hypothetical protein